jgi:hypothetical protein
MKSIFVIFLTACLLNSCNLKSEKNRDSNEINFVEDISANKIDVLVGGKLFTSFQWAENTTKPVFYPILASSGTEITRGFPLNPKPGERADHPHQIGIWLTYGNVNGLDYWGNGSLGLGTNNPKGGTIKHVKTEDFKEGIGKGTFVSTESWVDTLGIEILREQTKYTFTAKNTTRIIDRVTTLSATGKDVFLPDTKEGMFAIRLARQLELPSKGTVELYNADGTVTKIKDTLNIGITGNYISSEGIEGEAVWGTRARWMKIDGKIGEEQISVVICDHPDNPNYPTYWHARGYGLFSANPLGVKDFTKGADSLNLSIPAGQSATFRYRVIVNSGSYLTGQEINALSDEFALVKE